MSETETEMRVQVYDNVSSVQEIVVVQHTISSLILSLACKKYAEKIRQLGAGQIRRPKRCRYSFQRSILVLMIPTGQEI